MVITGRIFQCSWHCWKILSGNNERSAAAAAASRDDTEICARNGIEVETSEGRSPVNLKLCIPKDDGPYKRNINSKSLCLSGRGFVRFSRIFHSNRFWRMLLLLSQFDGFVRFKNLYFRRAFFLVLLLLFECSKKAHEHKRTNSWDKK